jgi:uncharacterized YccA/Bax inhibitor family protein
MAATLVPSSSGNPVFSGERAEQLTTPARGVATITVAGTAIKTFVMLALVVGGGAWGWASATTSVPVDLGSGYGNTTVTIPGGFWLVSILVLILGFMTAMSPARAPITGPLYAIGEGYLLGAISAAFNAQTEGIVAAAVLGTVAVFLSALLLYVTRIIRPTRKLAFAVTAGIGGLLLLYLVIGVFSLFDWGFLYSEQFRTMGIVVSVLTIVLAALSFTLDFAMIENAVEAGAPKSFEWYCAYGLTVTLVWLYLTILRLLALLQRN